MDIEVKKAKKDFLGIHEAKKILFEDALTEYLNWAQVSKAPNTYTMNRFYAAHLRKTFRGYLSALTAKQVEDYKVKRRAEVSPATVNRELALIKHLCTKAVEWGYLKANPLSAVRLLKEPPGRLRYLTHQEMETLINACSPHLRPIVVTALHTGMRKSEILGLTWQAVDFGAKTIAVRQTKNNEPRMIPMNQTLLLSFGSFRGGCTRRLSFATKTARGMMKSNAHLRVRVRKLASAISISMTCVIRSPAIWS
jgi:integrase